MSGLPAAADAQPAANLARRSAFPPIVTLRAFDVVARLGGVRRAAEAIDVNHSAISRHVRRLEDWVGTKLVISDRQGTRLTDAGCRLHAAIGPALATIAAAIEAASRQEALRLIVWSAPDFATLWLAPRFADFSNRYPKVDATLRPSNKPPDLLNSEADVEIRYVPIGTSGSERHLRAEDLHLVREVLVASPEYLATHAPIREPADILQHTLLHGADFSDWQEWLAANGCDETNVKAGTRFWYGHLALQAACEGAGIALMSDLVARDDIAAGRLEEVCGSGASFVSRLRGAYQFVAREDRWGERPIRQFRRWLADALHPAGRPIA